MPLSKQEIEQHLTRWKPLVLGMATTFRARLRPAHDFEDIVAIGMVALWRAAETFDETLGFKFSTYARRVVLHRFLLEVKNLNTHNRRVVYQCKQSLDAENEDGSPILTPRCEKILDPEASLAQRRTEEKLQHARSQLPERHRWVLLQRFERDRTLEEVGNDLGVTRERARQIEAEAIEKLRFRVSA